MLHISSLPQSQKPRQIKFCLCSDTTPWTLRLNGGIAPRLLNFSSRTRLTIRFVPRSLNPQSLPWVKPTFVFHPSHSLFDEQVQISRLLFKPLLTLPCYHLSHACVETYSSLLECYRVSPAFQRNILSPPPGSSSFGVSQERSATIVKVK
jgi:hypothetical protein